ncbi:MAG: nickel pincer cofactor biosynthesis protein LarC [Desulfobacterales bacterium]
MRRKVDVLVKGHAERDYAAIRELIENSGLSAAVKNLSLSIFEKLARAESKIHGCPAEHVHFHEVGGVDAVVDIVGAALCTDYLKLETVSASKIPLGSGFVTCSHGTLPVPAPATAEILKNVPVFGTDDPVELVTPTGAAIISTLATSFGPMPDMRVSKIGYGSGTRDLSARPNLLRLFIGAAGLDGDTVTVIETTIDDMNPEIFGFLMDRLFADGALDVYFIPVFMKKNRPGTLLQVLCHRKQRVADSSDSHGNDHPGRPLIRRGTTASATRERDTSNCFRAWFPRKESSRRTVIAGLCRSRRVPEDCPR